MIQRMQLRFVLVMVIAVALVAAACGGGSDAEPTPSSSAGDAFGSDATDAADEPAEDPPTVESEPEPEPEAPADTDATEDPDDEDDGEPGSVEEPVSEPPAPLPSSITIDAPNLFPEGIVWTGDEFLISSLGDGGVLAVADDGSFEIDTRFELDASTIGLAFKETEEGPFIAAVRSDPRVFLGDGERVGEVGFVFPFPDGSSGTQRVPVAGNTPDEIPVFANDIVWGDDVNSYLTNTLHPIVWRIGRGEDGLSPFILVDLGEIGLVDGNPGLNGIAHHPDGFLLVAGANTGELFKIPIDDPTAASVVAIDGPIPMDGMHLRVDDPSRLLGVALPPPGVDGTASLVELQSDDGWASARVVARGDLDGNRGPTTLTVRDGMPYVLHGELSGFFTGRDVASFEIRAVEPVGCAAGAAWPCG